MLFDKAPIGYQSIDGNGNLLEVNETWLEMMGYQENEVLGRWFGEFLTPESANSFNSKCRDFQSETTLQAEFEMIRKDGSVIRIHLQGRIGNTTSGAIKQTHCVISDITEQRRIETEIADERILLRTLIDNIPDIICVKDLNGRKNHFEQS